jgi:CRP-like cAMP-binding protein
MIESVLSCIKNVPLFAGLSEGDQRALAQAAYRRTFRKGDIVVREGGEGGTLYATLSGRFKVIVLRMDGRAIIRNFLGPGDIFGEISFLDGQPRSATVETCEDGDVLAIPNGPFLQLLRVSSDALDVVLKHLGSRLRTFSEECEYLTVAGTRARLARFVLTLIPEGTTGRMITLRLAVTQEEMASLIGTSRETVNRIFGEWEDDKLISRRGAELKIYDVPELQAIAEEDDCKRKRKAARTGSAN